MNRLAATAFAALLAAGCGTTVSTTASTYQSPGAAGRSGDGLSLPSSSGGTGPTSSGGTVGSSAQLPTATTTGDPGPIGPSGTTTGPTTPGSMSTTGPLTIGMTYIDNSGAESALGVNDQRTVTPKNVARAFVRAVNAAGGVAGRKLKAVEYTWQSQQGNWSNEATAACQLFTQDNHVSLVLDFAFGQIGGFRDCLQRAGVYDITVQDEGDAVSSASASLHVNPTGMTYDRGYGAVLEQLAATGYIQARNQLGVILEDCPQNNRAYSRTLLPTIKQLGLKTPNVQRIDCVTAFSSAGPATQRIGSAILQFRTHDVDRVMFVSAQEAAALLLFAPQADSQRYYPGYMLSSNAQAQLAPSQPTIPASQLPQIHGVGSAPYGDTSNAKPSDVEKTCLGLAKSGGVAPQGYDDFGQIIFQCAPFLLLDAAVKQTHGDATATVLARAIDGMGTAFAAPGIVSGRTRLTSSRHDGASAVRVFAYSAKCGCVRYVGPPVAVS